MTRNVGKRLPPMPPIHVGQPSLFADVELPLSLRCWWCKRRTPHAVLSAWKDGTRMVRCTVCQAGSNYR